MPLELIEVGYYMSRVERLKRIKKKEERPKKMRREKKRRWCFQFDKADKNIKIFSFTVIYYFCSRVTLINIK